MIIYTVNKLPFTKRLNRKSRIVFKVEIALSTMLIFVSFNAIDFKKLDSVPGLYKAAKRICSTVSAKAMQKANLDWLAVGSNFIEDISIKRRLFLQAAFLNFNQSLFT